MLQKPSGGWVSLSSSSSSSECQFFTLPSLTLLHQLFSAIQQVFAEGLLSADPYTILSLGPVIDGFHNSIDISKSLNAASEINPVVDAQPDFKSKHLISIDLLMFMHHFLIWRTNICISIISRQPLLYLHVGNDRSAKSRGNQTLQVTVQIILL